LGAFQLHSILYSISDSTIIRLITDYLSTGCDGYLRSTHHYQALIRHLKELPIHKHLLHGWIPEVSS